MDTTLARLGLPHCLHEKHFLAQDSQSMFMLELNLKSGKASTKMAATVKMAHQKRPPKYLLYPRRTKVPPDPGIHRFTKKKIKEIEGLDTDLFPGERPQPIDHTGSLTDDVSDLEFEDEEGNIIWNEDEIEAISSLFKGRVPQKPRKLNRERPLPLSLPYRIRPLGLPTSKRHVRSASAAGSLPRTPLMSKQAYKDPDFLINLARAIRSLSNEEDVSIILNKWGRYLRKGSLSLTIRELGHMGLPDRALQTFCWAQKQTHLFPDDRILASTVEILARNHELKLPFDLEKFTSFASRGVLEAMARGFIRGASLDLAWKLVTTARDGKRMLDPSIYAKLILELGKNPDRHDLVLALLGDLGERDDLKLSQQDCTAIMKICARLGKFELVESFYAWFKQSGYTPSIIMYTTVIHSRCCENKYREASALVWEMESANCLFDLPAYRVVIKLFVALNDLSRAVRYFSKLKEAGFSPTYDIYRNLIGIYMVSGRFSKCRELCKEVEMAGFKLDIQLQSQLVQLEREVRLNV